MIDIDQSQIERFHAYEGPINSMIFSMVHVANIAIPQARSEMNHIRKTEPILTTLQSLFTSPSRSLLTGSASSFPPTDLQLDLAHLPYQGLHQTLYSPESSAMPKVA